MTSRLEKFEAELVQGVAERFSLIPPEHEEAALRGIASAFVSELMARWPQTAPHEAAQRALEFTRKVRQRARDITRQADHQSGTA